MYYVFNGEEFIFFQAGDGIHDAQESRGLGDGFKRQRLSKEEKYLRKILFF